MLVKFRRIINRRTRIISVTSTLVVIAGLYHTSVQCEKLLGPTDYPPTHGQDSTDTNSRACSLACSISDGCTMEEFAMILSADVDDIINLEYAGETPLSRACKSGRVWIIEQLLNHKSINTSVVKKNGMTALMDTLFELTQPDVNFPAYWRSDDPLTVVSMLLDRNTLPVNTSSCAYSFKPILYHAMQEHYPSNCNIHLRRQVVRLILAKYRDEDLRIDEIILSPDALKRHYSDLLNAYTAHRSRARCTTQE